MTAEVQQAFAIGWHAGEYHVSVGDAGLTRDLVQLQAAMTAADFRYAAAQVVTGFPSPSTPLSASTWSP
jgi:hypothetical protein